MVQIAASIMCADLCHLLDDVRALERNILCKFGGGYYIISKGDFLCRIRVLSTTCEPGPG
ncbi:MAG: hypothetical protein DDT18_01092 [Actinobacteria bacterium]|nr:hypothetical protein [Actinomycetota bacterium]